MPNAIDQDPADDREESHKVGTWGTLAWGSLAFVLLGIWFRLWQLGQQPVLGDEMHALKSAASEASTLTTILAEKGLPDVCIPLALWNYLLLNTVGLTEWGMRFPMLISGILLVIFLHRLIHRQLGAGCAFAATGLASLSPLLILFSRYARPYMAITLLSLLALHFWLRHLEGKRLAWGWAVLATVVGAALSPVCLPALGSLAVTALALRALQKRRHNKSGDTGQTSREGLRWNLILVAIIGVIAALALSQTWHIGENTLGLAQATEERGRAIDWPNVGTHLIGTTRRSLVIAVAGLTLIGATVTWLRARHFALLLTAMIVVQTLAIITLVPWGDRTFSITRYCMVLLPGLLAWTAAGLDAIAGLIRSQLLRRVSGDRVRLGFTSVAVLLLLVMGPLPETFRAHNSFTSIWPTKVPLPPHYGSEERPAWPRFYNALMDYPDDLAILEAPTISTNRISVMPFASYQRVHGRRVLLMNMRASYRHKNNELQSTISGRSVGEVPLGDASLLIVHKDFEGERAYMHRLAVAQLVVDDVRGLNNHQAAADPRRMIADSGMLARAAKVLEYCLQDETLQTIYEDKWVRVFSRDPAVLARGEAWKLDSGLR